MDTAEKQLLLDNPILCDVLELYQELIEKAGESRSEEEQGIRWTERIVQFEGIDPESLTAVHGRLIALNWLTYQLEGRGSGLLYRITSEGRNALNAIRAEMESATANAV